MSSGFDPKLGAKLTVNISNAQAVRLASAHSPFTFAAPTSGRIFYVSVVKMEPQVLSNRYIDEKDLRALLQKLFHQNLHIEASLAHWTFSRLA